MMAIAPRTTRNQLLALGAGVAGQLAGNALRGAVRGTAKRVRNAASRYFQGDVNQPATSRTQQQVSVVGPRPRRRGPLRMQRNSRDSHTEGGTLKLFDVSTDATAAHYDVGKCIASFPMSLLVMGGRLQKLGQLYSKWLLSNVRARYVPCVSSATDGGIVMYYTQETDDTYMIGEPVGAGAAASAIDNMEFSVREKSNMPLHLGRVMLFTMPGTGELSLHSAGVINVISNGSLAGSKVYGSVYLDFTVRLEQPTAPFDPYGPMFSAATFAPHGAGAVGPGLASQAMFDWSADWASFDMSSGHNWIQDPYSGKNDTTGSFWLPPYSTCKLQVSFHDTAVKAGPLQQTHETGVVLVASEFFNSTDDSEKFWNAVVTNTLPQFAWVTVKSSATAGMTTTRTFLTICTVPYRTS